MEAFVLQDLNVMPGEKKRTILQVEACPFKMPTTVIRGKEDGPVLLITAGVHNMEFVGINAAIKLANNLVPENIKGTVIIISLVNTDGFEHRTMSVSYVDGKNLNRVFPGDKNGSPSEKLAAWFVEEIFPKIDRIIDLHSGDNYEELEPLVFFQGAHEEDVMEASYEMARAVDARYLIRSHVAHGGLYSEAGSFGVPGIILERGCLSAWTQEEVDADIADVKNIMAMLGILKHTKAEIHHHKPVFVHTTYAEAPHTGCWYPLYKTGSYVVEGEIVGEIRDYFGDLICVCTADVDGIILIQTKSLNVIKGDALIAIGCTNFEGHKGNLPGYIEDTFNHVHPLIDSNQEFNI